MSRHKGIEEKVQDLHLKRGNMIEFVSWDYSGEPGVRSKHTMIAYYVGMEYSPSRDRYNWESNEEHESNCRRDDQMCGFLVFSQCKEDALANQERELVAINSDIEGLVDIQKLKTIK